MDADWGKLISLTKLTLKPTAKAKEVNAKARDLLAADNRDGLRELAVSTGNRVARRWLTKYDPSDQDARQDLGQTAGEGALKAVNAWLANSPDPDTFYGGVTRGIESELRTWKGHGGLRARVTERGGFDGKNRRFAGEGSTSEQLGDNKAGDSEKNTRQTEHIDEHGYVGNRDDSEK